MARKLLLVVICSLSLVFLGWGRPALAQTGDCDANAIIRCGVFSMSELQTKMTGDVPAIYAHYGVSSASISSMVVGSVRKDGTVMVNGVAVATGAISAGRQNIPGSTFLPALHIFERPTSVSFRSNELSAFVSMVNGQFVAAIIQSCGNPVRATPVMQTLPLPQPPPPPTHPAITIHKSVSDTLVKLNQDFSYTLVIQNTGDEALTNIMVTDQAPSGVAFVESNGMTATQFTKTLPQLEVGASQTISIMARVTEQIPGFIINTACLTTTELPNQICASAQNQLECKPGIPLNSSQCRAPVPAATPVTPAAVVTPVAPTPPAALPNTGFDVFGLAGTTSVAGYLGALIHRRLRQKFLGI